MLIKHQQEAAMDIPVGEPNDISQTKVGYGETAYERVRDALMPAGTPGKYAVILHNKPGDSTEDYNAALDTTQHLNGFLSRFQKAGYTVLDIQFSGDYVTIVYETPEK